MSGGAERAATAFVHRRRLPAPAREAPALADVGILNLDEYGEVGNPATLGDFQLIRGFVARGLEKLIQTSVGAVLTSSRVAGVRLPSVVCQTIFVRCAQTRRPIGSSATWPTRRDAKAFPLLPCGDCGADVVHSGALGGLN